MKSLRTWAPKGPAAIALLLALSACQEEIYTNLPEREANQMTAILEASGVPSTRKRDKDGDYRLLVKREQVAAAITVLNAEGLPKRQFQSMGEVFDSGNLIGSPFEERARFIHALNEELSATLTSIDGIRSARVHIMIPERERFQKGTLVSSASVTIHYEPRFTAKEHVATIKQLVAHSVPNLSYDRVAVALFKAGGAQVSRLPPPAPTGSAHAATFKDGIKSRLSLNPPSDYARSVFLWIAGALGAVLLLWGVLRWRTGD
ncbi:MAG: type III secretion inner membrane ring lipoprotein SctJ [Pseudomonadota bacterium]